MTGKKKLGQKRVVLLTSAQVSPAIGGNVLLVHYTILNLCGNAPFGYVTRVTTSLLASPFTPEWQGYQPIGL